MTKAVVFDFWGTLVENGVYSPVKQVKWIAGIQCSFSDYIITFEESFMLKEFDNLSEAFEEVLDKFGIEPTQDKLDKLIGMWNKNRLLAKPFGDTIRALETFKKKYKIALLSNTDCFSVKPILEKYDLRKYFDEVFLSYQTGMLKTNPKIFELIANKLGVTKKDIVMVGDSLDSDIKGAESAGVRAVLLDRKGKRQYKEKIQNLYELEKIL